MLAHWIYCSGMFLSFRTIKFLSILSENKKNLSIGNVVVENACVCLRYSSIPISMHLHKMCENFQHSVELEIDFVWYFEYCSMVPYIQSEQRHFVAQKRCVVPVTSINLSESPFNRFMSHTYKNDIHDETWWLASFMMRCENLLPLKHDSTVLHISHRPRDKQLPDIHLACSFSLKNRSLQFFWSHMEGASSKASVSCEGNIFELNLCWQLQKKNAPITNIHLCLTNMMQNPLICWDIETWTAISRTIDHRNNEYFYNAMISVDFRMKFTTNKTENNNTFFRWEVSVIKKNWI